MLRMKDSKAGQNSWAFHLPFSILGKWHIGGAYYGDNNEKQIDKYVHLSVMKTFPSICMTTIMYLAKYRWSQSLKIASFISFWRTRGNYKLDLLAEWMLHSVLLLSGLHHITVILEGLVLPALANFHPHHFSWKMESRFLSRGPFKWSW